MFELSYIVEERHYSTNLRPSMLALTERPLQSPN